MHCYPINLNLHHKKCAIIGGGAVAERKAKSILAAGGEVFLISPNITAGLLTLAAEKKIIWLKRPYRRGDVEGFFLIICATDNSAVNFSAAQEAKEKNILTDVADNLKLSDFTVPAQIRRGNLLITVSSGGQSPAISREIKKEIEHCYGEEYGIYLELTARVRRKMKKMLPTPKDREIFWQKALDRLDKEVLALIKDGKVKEAEEKLAERMRICD